MNIIKKLLKAMLCDEDVHSFEDILNQEDAYHVCTICGYSVEWTQEEYMALGEKWKADLY